MAMTTHEKLGKAKAALILEQPFHASLICSMPLIADDTLKPPTMCTNGKEVRYHPGFVDGCSHDELKFVLCHETMHSVFGHMFRRGSRDPRRWNQAGDYIINDILVDEKIGSMPEGGLLNKALVQAGGGTTDGVYNLLPDQGDGNGPGGGAGEHGDPMDNCEDAPGSPAEQAQADAEMKIKIAQAAQAAKMCGKLSAGMARFVDKALKPKVDWRQVLRRFVSAKAKVEYSYARPKRRFIVDDLYLPSLGGEAMGELLVAVDCSGSIGPAELNEFAAEVVGIFQDCRPSKLHVVYFDSSVSHHEMFTQNDDLHIEAHGGGGTAFSPIFRFADEKGFEPVCCVVLTDLYCSDFGPSPAYPTLWITTGATEAPWGEVVEMKQKGA